MTFASDILSVVGDEPIEAVSISPKRGSYRGNDAPDHNLGSGPVSWEVARPVLDYSYDTSYGGQDCHDVWVWTPTRVLFVHEYDGATSVAYAPRFPSPFVRATQ